MYHHRIYYFPVMGVKRREVQVSKERGMKKERGVGMGGSDTILRTMPER